MKIYFFRDILIVVYVGIMCFVYLHKGSENRNHS